MTNQWSGVISQVQAAPANQRLDTCFTAIAEQMQNGSSVQEIQQLGQQLQQAKSQLIKALLAGTPVTP